MIKDAKEHPTSLELSIIAENSFFFKFTNLSIMYTNIRSHCLSCVPHTLYPESVPAPQECVAG